MGRPALGPGAPTGKHLIEIDPKGPFGNGNHPTTYGCLEAVERFLKEHPGASVLDVGTGTGVLAVAAALLGAGRVLAIGASPRRPTARPPGPRRAKALTDTAC